MAHARRAVSPERPTAPPAAPATAGARGVLAVRLLGGFGVALGGRAVEPGAWRVQKAQRIVKLLALAPGHRLGRDRLLDLLWPALDPDAAANNLHRTLHAARRALAGIGAADALPLRRGTVALDHPGGLATDVAAFEAAAATARRTRAPDDYRAALALYGGELLPDERYEDWAAPRREGLRQTHLDLLLGLAALLTEVGDQPGTVAALERAVAEEPAHEEAQVALMRAYGLAGRRAEALRQYARLREALHRDLAAEPEPATQALYAAILARRALAPTPAPTPPAGEPEEAPRHNLPAPLTGLVGRGRELATLGRLLPTTRLLSLVGPPGSGKTRLALALAHARAAGAHRDGVWLVALAPVADPAGVPAAVAAALGVRERPGATLARALAGHLRRRELLLVLDNCEHVAEACAELTAALLAAAPGLRVLATSRAALRVPGELTWRVPPLELPEDGERDPARVAASEAAQLLAARARWRVPGFAVDAGNAAAVAALCRGLDGLPLALELAAARLPALTVGQLAARLGDALGALGGGGRGVPARQRTLRAALDWSHGLLTEPERRLFRRLAAFVGGWDLAAAEAVCAGDGVEPGDVLELLAGLVDHSLVIAEPRPDGARYRLLEVVRQYAAERLGSGGEAAAARRAHAAHYLAMAEAAEPYLPGPEEDRWLARLEADWGNLRAALGWAVDAGEAATTLRLACALRRYWDVRGHYDEGRRWLGRALEVAGDVGSPLRLHALIAAATLALRQSDNTAGRCHATRALTMATDLGDQGSRADALGMLGYLAKVTGDLDTAARCFAAAHMAARASGGLGRIAAALSNLGEVARLRGDLGAARSWYGEARARYREAGDRSGSAVALRNLGTTARAQGDTAAARAYYEEGLALARVIGDRTGIAAALNHLGGVAGDEGEFAVAAALRRESLAMRRELGDRGNIAIVLHSLGHLALAGGDVTAAVALLEESLTHYRAIGDDRGAATTLSVLGAAALARRDAATAVALCAEGLALAQRIGTGADIALALSYAARAAQARGAVAMSRDFGIAALAGDDDNRECRARLATYRAIGELDTPPHVARRVLAALDAGAGRYAEAAGHLAASLARPATLYERALTLLALAEIHAATGERDGAWVRLAEARDILARVDAPPAAARAAALGACLARP